MAHASINHLAGGRPNPTATLGDSILRADRPASPRAAAQRAETLRSKGAVPPGDHSARPPTRFYIGRDPILVLRLPRRHSRLGTLADDVSKKARGVGASDGWNKDRESAAQTVDDEVPVRHLGSMWQGHVSHNE